MPTLRDPLVFVLILNYCSEDDTLSCVQSVQQVAYHNLRTLVLDNASPDGSGDRLKTRLNPDSFIQLNTNTGYAEGNNIGIRIALAAGADFIFILNPDIILNADTIRICVDAASADPSIGAINPIQLTADAHRIDSKFQRAVLEATGYIPAAFRQDELPPIVDTKTLFGAALFLPAQTFKMAGGFDPLFFAYGEEEDFCRRISRKGLRLVVATRSSVIHKRTNEGSGLIDFVIFLRLKGAYLYNLKNPNLGFRYALRRTFRDIILDLRGKRTQTYPFNAYPIKLRHILRAISWILINVFAIRLHRKLDEAGAPYI